MLFLTELKKIDYIKDYCKFIAYNVIKIKVDKDLTNLYLII